MALCNYSRTVVNSLNLQNFQTQRLEIDFNDVYVLRVGYTTNEMVVTLCKIYNIIVS